MFVSIPEVLMMWIGNVICALYIDKIGRRTIYLRAMPIAGLGWLLSTWGLYLIEYVPTIHNLVGSTITYSGILFYKTAFSTVVLIPWVMLTESLPISSIATANGLCLAIFNLLQFIMLSAFSIVLNSGNPAAIVSAFAFLSFSCYLCTLFFWKFCPETTRLSIAEILRKFVPSWRLKQFYNSD